jgi:hypothetical protein
MGGRKEGGGNAHTGLAYPAPLSRSPLLLSLPHYLNKLDALDGGGGADHRGGAQADG